MISELFTVHLTSTCHVLASTSTQGGTWNSNATLLHVVHYPGTVHNSCREPKKMVVDYSTYRYMYVVIKCSFVSLDV